MATAQIREELVGSCERSAVFSVDEWPARSPDRISVSSVAGMADTPSLLDIHLSRGTAARRFSESCANDWSRRLRLRALIASRNRWLAGDPCGATTLLGCAGGDDVVAIAIDFACADAVHEGGTLCRDCGL